jgi:hypothetical protein
MSGGHFNGSGYVYYQVSQFADELENEIERNMEKDEYGYRREYSKETLDILKSQINNIRRTAEIMRHVDYLYSGDHGEDSFKIHMEKYLK